MARVSQKRKRISKKKLDWDTEKKDGEVVGPDNIPVETWKCFEYLAVNLLTKTIK